MVKTLLSRVREYKRSALLTPVLMIGEAAMEIIIPFVMGELVNYLQQIVEGAMEVSLVTVLLYGLAMLVCAGFSLFCGVTGGFLGARASSGFAKNLRKDMYANIQTFSFSNIDKFSTASLITRLTTDVTNVQQAFQMCIRILVRAPILFLFATIMSFSINVKLALMFIAAALLMAAIVILIMLNVMPSFRTMFRKYDDLNSVVQEDLTGVRVVKSYVREEHEIEKFQYATGQVYHYSVKAEKMLNFLTPIVNFIMYGTIILLFLFGGKMVIAEGLLVGDLSKLLSYATQILNGLLMAAMSLNYISMSKGSMDRIAEVLEEKPNLENPASPVFTVSDGSVDFNHVSFSYREDGEETLSDIDLHIRSGQTVGIIGGTGSAKSTLVSLIPRLYDVKEGCIRVGGRDVREYDLETLRNNVAVVLQKNVLFSGSITENLKWGDEDATDEEIRAAAAKAQAEEFIDAIPEGYDYDLGQGGVNVSGGQKQRLCIARALLKNPKVLILDDSTSAVDTRTDALIRDALKRYAPEVTKIIIAQRISSVQESDLIVVLDDGKIAASGTHEELLKSSVIYREVYESQMKGGSENG